MLRQNLVIALIALGQQVYPQYFTKITNTPISANLTDSRSVNWVDVNNDGKLDLFISNGPNGGQNNSLYLNNSAGSFSLVTTDPITLDGMPSDGATFADVNNDGSLDAFVANWYNYNNLFYKNTGNGTFTFDNSQILSNDFGYSETAAWGDYDKDGLVDLYVTNSAGTKVNFLYHNSGNYTFTKVTVGDPVTDAFYSRNANWVDIDYDNDLDLFVTNENNQNENIYRNDGLGVFTKLTSGVLLNEGRNTNSSSWADFDNDGDLDVFLANDGSFNSLYKNNGGFNFVKVTTDTVAKTPSRSFSSAWSDIDNDGDLDLFVTNSFGTTTKQLNYLYVNDGLGNFARNSTDVAVNDSSWSYGCAFGDYDNDGFEDLAVATCRFGGIDQGDFLYHNNTNANKWITIKLTGTVSNKSAIGTKIKVKAIINGTPTWQMREISSQSSYCSQNDLRAHFGLKGANQVDSVLIEWPLGMVETYTNVGVNQFVEYIEGASFVGLKEARRNDRDLLVYPNPSNNDVILRMQDSKLEKGTKVALVNSQGKALYNYILQKDESEMVIDLRKITLTDSVYFIIVTEQNGLVNIKKLIIK